MAPEPTHHPGRLAATGSEQVDTQAHLWRRQVQLVVASAIVVLGAIGLLVVTLGLTASAHERVEHGPHGSVVVRETLSISSPAMWPALLGLVAVAVILTLSVVHTLRVAAFAFRLKGDDR